jgi:glycosyltransferase involved in cell wall biosynthesis
MKIFHFIYDHINNPWVGGGGAVRVYEIYKRLAKSHLITVVCGKYPGAHNYNEGNLGFHFVGTNKKNYVLSTFSYAPKAMIFLYRHRKNADIVIEDFSPYNPLLSKFIVNKPLVLQIHHREGINLFNRYFVFGCPFILAEAYYPKLFRNVICVSEESKRKFNIKNAAIIPNGIDPKLFDVLSSDGDYISYVGRLQVHNKGLDTLVKAMDLINSKLIIAGRGKDKLKLKSLVRRSGASDKVELIGYLSDSKKIEFLANSKIVVIPSRYEGQAIVVLEAAACGKPVIVSDIPELRYAVNAGFGISFRTGSAKDLAEQITYLLKNPALRKNMGQKAREFAKNYTWDKIAEEYERFLTKVKEEDKHLS